LIIEPWIWKAAAIIFGLSLILAIMVIVCMANELMQIHKSMTAVGKTARELTKFIKGGIVRRKQSINKSETQKMIDEILERGQ